jgi:hypothetical protein
LGDADFYGRWLVYAAHANKIFNNLKLDDPQFRAATETIEIAELLDFGIAATHFLCLLRQKFETFILETGDLVPFVLMVGMGFFTRTGDRYQMTLPLYLDADGVKKAHLELMRTQNVREDWIHPERLVVSMPLAKAANYQGLLSAMDQEERIAERRALLSQDSPKLKETRKTMH